MSKKRNDMAPERLLQLFLLGLDQGTLLQMWSFHSCFLPSLGRVRAAILDAGISVSLPWRPLWPRRLEASDPATSDLAPIDVSWMDDLVLLIWDSCPKNLVASVQSVVAILLDHVQALPKFGSR